MPFAFIVKLPCALEGPEIILAVKAAPVEFLSFVKTLPVAVAVPFVLATTVVKSSAAVVVGAAVTGFTVKYATAV